MPVGGHDAANGLTFIAVYASGGDTGGRSDHPPAQAGKLAVLEPLWKSLQEHHAQITPRLGPSPKRDAEDSWQRRLAKYELWAKDPDTFVIIAERGGRAIGYAFVTVRAGHASWTSGDRIAELETWSF